MRIIECYVRSFGAIKNLRLEFDKGLNCFLGDNGIGKSTVLAFIKAMLYGLGETRKASIEENDRKHYLPWDGSAAGGTLTFGAGGKQYRIERSFGKRPTDDTFALYDTRLGRECDDFSSNLGEELFGIDAVGFERTAFFSERNLIPEADISSSGTGEDGAIAELSAGALKDACDLLDDKRRFYQKKGGGGAIADLKLEIAGVDRELKALAQTRARAKENEARISNLLSLKEEAERKTRSISERRGKLQARAAMKQADIRIKDIRDELRSLGFVKDSIIEFFGGNIPTGDQLSELEYKSKRAAELKSQEHSFLERDGEKAFLSKKFEGKMSESDEETLRQAISTVEARDDIRGEKCEKVFSKRIPSHEEIDSHISSHTAKKSSGKLLPLLMGILLMAAGGVLGFTVSPLCYAICGGGVLAAVIGTVLSSVSSAKAKAAIKSSDEELFNSIGAPIPAEGISLSSLIEIKGLIDEAEIRKNRLSAALEIIDAFGERFPDGGDGVIGARKTLEQYERYRAICGFSDGATDVNPAILGEKLLIEVAEALSAYKIETANPIFEAKEKAEQYHSITSRIISLNKELENLSSMKGLDDLDEQSSDTPEGLDHEAREVSVTLSSSTSELAILTREYDNDMRALEDVERLTIERSKLAEKLSQYELELKTILATQKYLVQAADAMNEKYLAGTLSAFRSYAASLGLSDGGAEMKTDFSTSVVDGTGTHPTESFSRGSRDGYRLAARLAILDSLYSGESSPLLLDDPFLSYDDDRVSEALTLLEKVAKERQVIYLTCSDSRATDGKRALL